MTLAKESDLTDGPTQLITKISRLVGIIVGATAEPCNQCRARGSEGHEIRVLLRIVAMC